MPKVTVELTPDDVKRAIIDYVSKMSFVLSMGRDVRIEQVELEVETRQEDRSEYNYTTFKGAKVRVGTTHHVDSEK